MAPSRRFGPLGWLAWLAVAIGGVLIAPTMADEPLAQRRARVGALSPTEKSELAERQKYFASLDPAEQKRLREFARKLAEDERSEQLRRVMHRYYQWLTTLLPYERSELLRLPPPARLKRIQELLKEESRKTAKPSYPRPLPPADRVRRWLVDIGVPGMPAAKRLGEEDLKIVQAWLGQALQRHSPMIINRLSEPQRQKARPLLESAKEDPERRKTILATAWLQLQLQRPPLMPAMGEKELSDLHGQLTPAARQQLTGLTPQEQRRTLILWTRLVAIYEVLQHPEPAFPLIEEEDLARFFEETLDLRERDRLLSLPGEDMHCELVLSYLRWRLTEDRPRPAQRPGQKRDAVPAPPRGAKSSPAKGNN